MNKYHLSKVISATLLMACIYWVPKTITLFSYLNSGVIRGYATLLIPVNMVVIIFALLSLLAFKKQLSDVVMKRVLIFNVVVFIFSLVWFPLIHNT